MFLYTNCMEKLIALGILLIFVGVAVLVIGVGGTVHQKATGERGEIKAGGVILIGPIPIVFGTDKTMVFLSIAGAVLLLLAYYVWRR